MTFKAMVQSVIQSDILGGVFSRLITGSSPSAAVQGMSLEAWKNGMAMFLGVDQILLGDDSIWNATAVAGRFTIGKIKSVVKELRNCSITKQLGESITCDIFAEGEKVSVIGTTKGKGFQGVVKRHGFSGVGEATHGQHDRQRAPGSIGGSSYPSRVFKGMRMAGRMGGDSVKVKALRVVKIFPEQNYILISGSVPGHNGSIVLIQN
jgi:50S ribosomal protein uL3